MSFRIFFIIHLFPVCHRTTFLSWFRFRRSSPPLCLTTMGDCFPHAFKANLFSPCSYLNTPPPHESLSLPPSLRDCSFSVRRFPTRSFRLFFFQRLRFVEPRCLTTFLGHFPRLAFVTHKIHLPVFHSSLPLFFSLGRFAPVYLFFFFKHTYQ